MADRITHKRIFMTKAFTSVMAATSHKFFGSGKRGQDTTSYNAYQTNDDMGGTVPANRSYQINAMGWHIGYENTADSAEIMAHLFRYATFRFRVGTVDVIDGEPLALWPSGAGWYVPTVTAMFGAQLGRTDKMRKLSIPINLEGGNTYESNLDLGVILSGIAATTVIPVITQVLDVIEKVGNAQ